MDDGNHKDLDQKLVNDAEFAQLIEKEVAEGAGIDNDLAKQRVLTRLRASLEQEAQSRPSANWRRITFSGVAAGVLALSIASLFVPRPRDEDRQPKSGHTILPGSALFPHVDLDADGTHLRLNGSPLEYQYFAIVAIEKAPQLLWKGFGKDWQGSLDIEASAAKRFCLLLAETPAELERKWALIVELKTYPEDGRCVDIGR